MLCCALYLKIKKDENKQNADYVLFATSESRVVLALSIFVTHPKIILERDIWKRFFVRERFFEYFDFAYTVHTV